MTKLTEEEVKHVAKLAKLTLAPGEVKKFQKQLSEILVYVGQLQAVKTGKVEPTNQVTGLENVFREDQTKTPLSQIHQGYFKTKAIFDK